MVVALLAGVVFASSAFAAVERIEENDARVVKTGEWLTSPLSGHSGGAVDYTSDGTPPIGSATLSFTGTGVNYIAAKWFNRGYAAVSLDGGTPQYIDLYAPGVAGDTSTVSFQQVVYSAQNLTNGPHTLTVSYHAPLRNPAASSPWLITVDAFDVTTPDPPVVSTSASSAWSIGLGVLIASGFAALTLRRRTS